MVDFDRKQNQLQKRLLKHQAQQNALALQRSMSQEQARYILTALCQSSAEAGNQQYLRETPTEKQQQFLDAGSFEALFGGSAGGGKSSALLYGAVRCAAMGGSALVIRRTFADLALPGAIMDRSQEWLANTDATWHERDKRWSFPSGGVIQFGYMETEQDKYRYQGAEFQSVFVDELTQLTETQYLYVVSRVRRRVGANVPLQVRCASNPGGVGHDWVKKRFVVHPEGRVFVPARLFDNPHIDQESYASSLELLDKTTRDQLLHGKWVRDDSGVLYQFDADRNGIASSPFNEYNAQHNHFILGIDLGASKSKPTTAFTLVGYSDIEPNNVYVVASARYRHITPTDCAQAIYGWQRQYPIDRIVCDAGALGAGYVEEFRQRYGLAVEPAQKRDKLGVRKLINGAFERGEVRVVLPGNEDLIQELQSLCWDTKGLDANPTQDDHQTDSLLYAWREAKSWASEEIEEPPSGSPERAQWVEDNMRDNLIRRSQQNRKRTKRGGIADIE